MDLWAYLEKGNPNMAKDKEISLEEIQHLFIYLNSYDLITHKKNTETASY